MRSGSEGLQVIPDNLSQDPLSFRHRERSDWNLDNSCRPAMRRSRQGWIASPGLAMTRKVKFGGVEDCFASLAIYLQYFTSV